jgi:cyanate permease
VSLAGLLLFALVPSYELAVLGVVAWGAGAALGFPVGMSAAADDPVRAAVRVSVVSSIGYVAFLAGPPLIGFLGEHTGTLRALTVTGGLVALGLMISGVLRPPGSERAPAGAPASADAR